MRGAIALLLLVLLTSLQSACDAEPEAPLVAADVFVYQSAPGNRIRAGYLSLTNNSDSVITIDRVTSPEFASVEMHETQLENGNWRMRPLPALSIAPGQTLEFARGGKHLMLTKPVAEISSVTLQFYSNDALLLSVAATQYPLKTR
jgi:copper(I)-binding protein